MRRKLPKKILTIKECTFILPDDFDGGIEDAVTEFLRYRQEKLKNAELLDEHGLLSTFSLLMTRDNCRACGQYALLELKNGSYVAVQEETND